MANILYNNFTNGIVSPKLWGQVGSALYHNGCSKLENFIINPQGGVQRRYPTSLVSNDLANSRLIPLSISESLSFIIELGNNQMRVWKIDSSATEDTLVHFNDTGSVSEGGTTVIKKGSAYTTIDFDLFTENELDEVQFAQGINGNKIFLCMVHKNHSPVFMEYETYLGLLYLPYQLRHNTENGVNAIFSIDPETHSEYEDEDTGVTTYGLFEGDDCPSVVFYYASRLWFANSKNHPYRMWASRPFNPINFEMVNFAEIVDDVTTSEEIISAVENNESMYTVETQVRYQQVIREDNAMLLELGSSKNDSIQWISSIGNNLVIGTTSSEWLISGSINALNPNAYQASAYGSSFIQPVMAGNDLLFMQTGSRKLRAYVGSNTGYACEDLNFVSGPILDAGVKHLVFMRTPNPMLFAVLKDGSLAVLFYDRQYTLQGWSVWNFTGEVKSMCVVDTTRGQKVYLVVKRGELFDLECFVESNTYLDNGSIAFDSKLATTTYESTTSLGKRKRIYEACLRVIDTPKLEVGCYWGTGTSQEYVQERTIDGSNFGMADVNIPLAGGYQKFLAFKVNSVEENPLNLDAISLIMEAE